MLASAGWPNWGLIFQMVIATTLVIASACVVNNYIDRQIDSRMSRTKNRELVIGKISVISAITFSLVMGAIGFCLLANINWLTFGLALLAYAAYIVLYGLAKRSGPYGTPVGTISGALPPVAGYAAVSGHLDIAAATIFGLLVVWQMAHFYAVGIHRLNEYQRAKLPILPVVSGVDTTVRQIRAYILGYVCLAPMLSISGYTGITFVAGVELTGLLWLRQAHSDVAQPKIWALQSFRLSLLVILCLDIMLALGPILV